ncbi:MAG TPA: UV DNA damage repair endonuclease UvsE [Abditibacteriaceae bacterium]|jgi:UV DNA damage endonuclease
MRLGFAVKVLGREGLKSNDARRWQNSPHLSVSVQYVDAIFDYLAEAKISMYRISSDFAPYLTHPEMPQFHNQLVEARADLEALGKRANELNLRLSFHPSQFILLNSPTEKTTAASLRDLNAQAEMLDIMEQGPEAVVVTHVGGVYGDRDAARARFVERFALLSEPARRRLVLENDDASWGVADVLRIHESTGIRCIFDHQHHNCINAGEGAVEACCDILQTWPESQRPKIHYSSPRQEDRIIERKDKDGKRIQSSAAPLASQHADYIDTSVFVPFARSVREEVKRRGRDCGNDIPFDVMCEAKAKDLAVLQLKRDLTTEAPEIPIK